MGTRRSSHVPVAATTRRSSSPARARLEPTGDTMGTWDDGLLDNDAAHEGLGDLRHEILDDIERYGGLSPSAIHTARLTAAIGVLLQVASYELGPEGSRASSIATALGVHGAEIRKLPAPARGLLAAVARQDRAVTERRAE